jgi:hypothetical protein
MDCPERLSWASSSRLAGPFVDNGSTCSPNEGLKRKVEGGADKTMRTLCADQPRCCDPL